MSYDWEHLGHEGLSTSGGRAVRKGIHIHGAADVAAHPHIGCPRPGPPGSPAGAAVDEIPGAEAAARRGEQGG